MNTRKVNAKQCKMVAHRGCSGLEKENTLAAFIAAGNRSYWGVETDVHRTADGEYVVIHDSETGRVAGDNIVILESMKMEIPVVAPQDGTVASIDVAVGDAVEAGATLASLN